MEGCRCVGGQCDWEVGEDHASGRGQDLTLSENAGPLEGFELRSESGRSGLQTSALLLEDGVASGGVRGGRTPHVFDSKISRIS